ncbi:MFS transporter [Nocardia terpenica]|uniref:MFS transporter n=2 Tax=Nocardia terpenica TaxID=455432 RepID=A0A291RPG0_9NOCA|nr:MFS transporter [Nocardia terpenica]
MTSEPESAADKRLDTSRNEAVQPSPNTHPAEQTPLTESVRRGEVDGTDRSANPKRWWILAVLGVAQLMVILDVTIVNIALPGAQADLEFTDANRQWVITGYALPFGSLLLLGGRISDMFGRRNTFLVALVGFAIASAAGGAAVNFPILVVARICQGVFAALLAPTALALLTVTFTDQKERARAFGVFGAIVGIASAVGLLLGGALTEWASWRWSMYVNLIFAGVALLGAALLLPRDTRGRPILDLPGAAAATAGLFSLVYSFSRADTHGWLNGGTIGLLVAGSTLLIVFVALQTRVRNPLIPVRILLDRTRGGSYIGIFIMGTGMFAVYLFLTYYMQLVLNYSPLRTGVAFLPLVLSLSVAAVTIPTFLMPRIGAKSTIGGAFGVSAVGLLLLTYIRTDSMYIGGVLPGLTILGFGVGVAVAVTYQGSTAGVEPRDAGAASATLTTMQQVGGSIGTALLNTIAATTATHFLRGKTPSRAVIAQAQVEGFVTVFWWGIWIFLLGGLLVVLLMPNRLAASADEDSVALL